MLLKLSINVLILRALYILVIISPKAKADSSSTNLQNVGVKDTLNSGLNFQVDHVVPAKSRSRRKVLARGGHYALIKSGSGGPWGSSSSSSFGEPIRRRKPRPNYAALGGNMDDDGVRGNSRYSSRNVKRYGGDGSHVRTRQKVSRSLKEEIAQYAIEHGAQKAAVKYEDSIGRRLRDRVIEKFVKRYQKKKKKMHSRGRH